MVGTSENNADLDLIFRVPLEEEKTQFFCQKTDRARHTPAKPSKTKLSRVLR